MRAAARLRLTNNIFYTTFALCFATVASSSLVPCPAHSISNEDERFYEQQQQLQQQQHAQQLQQQKQREN
ncbi:hypothetical protein WICPIJ_002073 [Wickerhamomyces pijperi]|uniref:Secreted protein n=1 Tax=Wickerhamomyces pijperi TaxID=599730 RepID=A0A9P8Q9K6_WICPI|nr:hypothetical protein WICPIJ_002073 [Wickerhamomyces pijperi]